MKNKNLIITVLAVLVVGLAGYVAYDKIFSENLKSGENTTNDTNTNNENKNDAEVTILDTTKLEKYKNEDGTYGTLKSFFGTDYGTNLTLNGEVTVCYQSKCNKLTNINNVVDMIEWSIPASEIYQKILFLLEDGTIYSYSYEQYTKNDFKATKMENFSGVKRMFEFFYKGISSGGCHGAVAITDNNNYVEIYKECV